MMIDEQDVNDLEDGNEYLQNEGEDAAFEAAEKARAETLGWKGLDEFRGNKTEWKDYPEFLEFGENRIAVMSDNMMTMQRELQEMKRRESLQNSTHATAMKAQRLRIEGEYADKVQEAIAEGDKDIETRAASQRDKELAVYQEPEPQENPYDIPLAEFASRNSWYGENTIATRFADGEGADIRETNPSITPEKELELVEQAVRKNFPDLFSNPNRQRASAVGSGRRPARGTGGKSYSAMSPEDQRACDEAVEYGFVKDKKAFVDNHFLLKEKSGE